MLSRISSGRLGCFRALSFLISSIALLGVQTTHAVTVTEFPLPSANSYPYGIAAGPDGNLWFTERDGNKIGRITTAGTVTEFSLPTAGSQPYGITAGPDGHLWFTERGGNKIGRITIGGAITEFSLPTAGSQPYGITAGPDNNLWFTEYNGNKIGQITIAGVITEFSLPTAGSQPYGITAGPDGNLWFTENYGNKIGRITTAGVITEFPVPTAFCFPSGITAGPDGNLWFTENAIYGNKIGRITTGGVITEFPLPVAESYPGGIVAGLDGNLWFAEGGHDAGGSWRIGRITTGGGITEFPVSESNSGMTVDSDGNLWFTEVPGKIGKAIPDCTYSISPTSRTHGSGAETGSLTVTVPTGVGCSWTATSNDTAWLIITSGISGTVSGTVNYSVSANFGLNSRTGTLTVAGQTFTVTQNGTCTYSISPTSRSHGSLAETGSVTVTTGVGCTWTASTNSGSWDWIGISSGSNGTGSGSVSYSVLPNNTGSTRTGTLTIAGQTFTITQSAQCSYAIFPTGSSIGLGAGSGSVTVTTGAGCTWTASTNSGSWDWIGISSGSNGTGNGSVSYSVLPNNTGSTRTGTLTIAGQTFTITQSGVCSYTLSPTGNTFGRDAGSASLNVITSAGCSWSASTNPGSWDWIGISSGFNGTGNGSVSYSVLPNNTGSPRTGTLTIAGRTFTITQSSECSYTLFPTGISVGSGAGSGSVTVTTGAGCTWTASTNSGSWDWIGISSGSNGTGNGTVSYFVLSNNTGNPRTGSLTIAGQTFAIAQSGGCSYALSPTGSTFGRDASSASVNIITSAGCSWSASTNPGSWDWLGISSGWSGTGSGTVNYFVLANNTGQNRSGTVTIAGKTFTVSQNTTAVPRSDPYLISEDFEKHSVNEPLPSPWSSLNSEGLPGIVTDQAFQSGEKSLFLSDGFRSAVVDIGDLYGPSLSYEVYIKLATPHSGAFVGFFEEIDNQTPEFNAVYFSGGDGKIYFTSSDKEYPVHVVLAKDFEIGTWNRVRVDLNFETFTGDIYLNDVLIGDSIPISPKDATWGSGNLRLRKIGMLHALGDGVYFDDFSVRKE